MMNKETILNEAAERFKREHKTFKEPTEEEIKKYIFDKWSKAFEMLAKDD